MTFYETLTAACNDFAERGYVNEAQLAYWMEQIRTAARASMMSEAQMTEQLQRAFRSIYDNLVEKSRILDRHPEIPRFKLAQVKPRLRLELDRRILASANLIKLNREESVQATLRRFGGWATSIPAGGSDQVKKAETKAEIRKSLAALPFQERRVAIDQGHKFAANLSDILATDAGALAARWAHHHVTYPRLEHVARNGEIFLIKETWAIEKGLVKPNANGYFDDIDKPGQKILCHCSAVYLYSLRQLPTDMLTVKGRAELSRILIVA